MTKKQHQHHEQPHFKLSKHAESKIERHARIQRLIVIASAVFLGAVALVVGIGLYMDRVAPRNEPVLRVNDRIFTLGYYTDALRLYSQGTDPTQIAALADPLLTQLVRGEVIRQAAPSEGIVITQADVKAEIQRAGIPSNRATEDLAETALATQALTAKFKAALPAEVEQVRFEIMMVESRSVATEVENAIATGASLVDLSEQYSAGPEIPVLQDWVPYSLLANKDVATACQTLEPGKSAVISDPTAVKNIGYWIIEVIDRDDAGAIKTRAMLTSSLEEALRAEERLQTEDFATVAEQYSQIYSSTENAEFDWITPEDVVTETFNAAAFQLELNVVSEPIRETAIQTSGAFWVVRLLERDTRALYDNIAEAQASSAFDAWYAEVSQAAVVEQSLTDEQKAWALERVA